MIKVLVDCRLVSGESGGIEQAVIGIARAMKESRISDIKFYWLVYELNDEWLIDHIPENSEIIQVPFVRETTRIKNLIYTRVRNIRTLSVLVALLRMYGPYKFEIESEPHVVKLIDPDLIHFPFQVGFRTQVPSIYQPHDLQHLHLPKNFTFEDRFLRNFLFSKMISQSKLVIVGNEWTKKDFAGNYSNHYSKFVNVPLYPQLLDRVNVSQSSEFPYFLYPAAGWKHKNHIRLLNAFKLLLTEFPKYKLVLTGSNVQDNPTISKTISNLDLKESIVRVGFVSPTDLAKLYEDAVGVIIPTLFESASFPVWEAFEMNTPVAVSNITSIPSQVDDGALLFDPYSEHEILEALRGLIRDEEGNINRVEAGKKRVSLLTADNTAYGYRYFYRFALGMEPDESDQDWERAKFIF